MANVYAVKSGNWSDPTVWNTGELPTADDDVYSNSFTVTIDVSPTVLSIRNSATTGVTAGGSFNISATGITVTGNVIAGPSTCLLVNIGAGGTASIVGECSGGYGSNASGVRLNTAGTLNVTGNCNGGRGNNSFSFGAVNSSGGTVNITGDCTGANIGASHHGANNASGGTLNIIGNCIGGLVSAGSNHGAGNSSIGTLNHIGTVQATLSPGISGSINGTTILSGPFLTSASGVNPVYALRWFWQNTTPPATYYQIRSANLSVIRPLYTADSVGGNPAAANVRSGTVFGPSNELTGTLAVPPAGSVALGVPVDNTTGTAYLTQSDITTAATAALTAASAVTFNQDITTLNTPNSIGERLKNSATVATVSQQLSDALSSRV